MLIYMYLKTIADTNHIVLLSWKLAICNGNNFYISLRFTHDHASTDHYI